VDVKRDFVDFLLEYIQYIRWVAWSHRGYLLSKIRTSVKITEADPAGSDGNTGISGKILGEIRSIPES